VDRRRPALHVIPGSLLAAAHRLFLLLPAAAANRSSSKVRTRREGSEGFNLEKNAQHQLSLSKCTLLNGQTCIDFSKVLVSYFV
jgi:hypothetical protein